MSPIRPDPFGRDPRHIDWDAYYNPPDVDEEFPEVPDAEGWTCPECLEDNRAENKRCKRCGNPRPARKLTEERCHADRDGDCVWSGCPQLRDGEPQKTGRHCPLDHPSDAL